MANLASASYDCCNMSLLQHSFWPVSWKDLLTQKFWAVSRNLSRISHRKPYDAVHKTGYALYPDFEGMTYRQALWAVSSMALVMIE